MFVFARLAIQAFDRCRKHVVVHDRPVMLADMVISFCQCAIQVGLRANGENGIGVTIGAQRIEFLVVGEVDVAIVIRRKANGPGLDGIEHRIAGLRVEAHGVPLFRRDVLQGQFVRIVTIEAAGSKVAGRSGDRTA